MLWRRTPRPLTIPPSAPVPDAEALRRAALQASWQRDRWVARRRVWLRWLLWASGRYVMPALLFFGVGAWLWLAVLPGVGNPLDPLKEIAIFQRPATNAPSLAAKPAEATSSPDGDVLPLALRLEPSWAAASVFSIGKAAADPAALDTSTPTQPHLKPETWLHSKEP